MESIVQVKAEPQTAGGQSGQRAHPRQREI